MTGMGAKQTKTYYWNHENSDQSWLVLVPKKHQSHQHSSSWGTVWSNLPHATRAAAKLCACCISSHISALVRVILATRSATLGPDPQAATV